MFSVQLMRNLHKRNKNKKAGDYLLQCEWERY